MTLIKISDEEMNNTNQKITKKNKTIDLPPKPCKKTPDFQTLFFKSPTKKIITP